MSPASATHMISPKRLLAFGVSLLSLTPVTNAWMLEFWSGQADCNYKVSDTGRKIGADTSRGGIDHMSNNCMSLSYDPDTYGLVSMRVTGWTGDCAIALWSDKSGSIPCRAEVPFGIDEDSQPPDYVFTLKSPAATMATDEDGNDYACISPLYEYVASNSGFLGYVAYSCGGNGTILVDEFDNDYDGEQVESLIKSLTATATTTSTAHKISTHKSSKVTTRTSSHPSGATLATTHTSDHHSSAIAATTHTSHDNTSTSSSGESYPTYPASRKLRIGIPSGLPPRPTTLLERRLH